MFSRLAQLALVALALTISNQANAGETVYGTYHDEAANACCSSVAICRVNLSQPATTMLRLIFTA